MELKMKTAPIGLFVYKRLEETKLTIEALKLNFLAEDSDLYIFSDGPKSEIDRPNVESVREYLKNIDGFRRIIVRTSDSNMGLANSIISGVSYILNFHENVIVLEDDLVTSSNFLAFMNSSLLKFKNRNDIQSINGYSPYILKKCPIDSDVFLYYRTFSWGWATWKKFWDLNIFSKDDVNKIVNTKLLSDFNLKCGDDMAFMLKSALDEKIDSWYIFWAFNHFINNRLAIYPYLSKINNIGYGNDSTHCEGILTITSKFDSFNEIEFVLPDSLELNEDEAVSVYRYFTKRHKILFRLKMLSNPRNFLILVNELKKRILK